MEDKIEAMVSRTLNLSWKPSFLSRLSLQGLGLWQLRLFSGSLLWFRLLQSWYRQPAPALICHIQGLIPGPFQGRGPTRSTIWPFAVGLSFPLGTTFGTTFGAFSVPRCGRRLRRRCLLCSWRFGHWCCWGHRRRCSRRCSRRSLGFGGCDLGFPNEALQLGQ